MMTPVYNVATAGWRTNSCNIFSYAARRGTSVFSTYKALEKGYFRSIKKHLFSCRFHNIKKHTFQCFHFLTDETTENLSRTQHQLRKDNSLLSSASSRVDIFSVSLNPDRQKISRDKYLNKIISKSTLISAEKTQKMTSMVLNINFIVVK